MANIKKFIGVDLGTSSIKMILVDKTGKKYAQVTEKYPIEYPKPGWSQQNPYDWYDAMMKGLSELVRGYESDICGLGIGGQMHGLVTLDSEDKVIRPAILWNDGRTEEEVKYLNETIGKDVLSELTANIAFAGFTAPKILWMKKNEPELFARIRKIMLPKDYLVYRLTGKFATDVSDASGMLLLDVKNRKWSPKMCEICGITEEILPTVYESMDVVGEILPEITTKLGLSSIKVVTGAGDNAAAAIGTGTIRDGSSNISLGTSGTIFVSSDKFALDEWNALHSFDHANGKYHLMGCMLSAASCNGWWMDILSSSDYSKEFGDIDKYAGDNNVYFLPYLMGERSPLNDVNARGAFIGMDASVNRTQMSLAVIEGVSFALKDQMEIIKKLGINVKKSMACGGGTRTPHWPQILSDILNIEITIPEQEEGPSMGGAILAMTACGEYDSLESACDAIVRVSKTFTPRPEIASKYARKYENFKLLYPALKETFKKIR